MIERQGVDKLAIFREFGLEPGELVKVDRDIIKEMNEAAFADEEGSNEAGDLCLFFKKLAQYEAIEGVSFSSEPNGIVHVDYFCTGDDGIEISNVILRIELARYFVGNPLGSIQWIGRNLAFEDTVRKFRSELTNGRDKRDLHLVAKFV